MKCLYYLPVDVTWAVSQQRLLSQNFAVLTLQFSVYFLIKQLIK